MLSFSFAPVEVLLIKLKTNNKNRAIKVKNKNKAEFTKDKNPKF